MYSTSILGLYFFAADNSFVDFSEIGLLFRKTKKMKTCTKRGRKIQMAATAKTQQSLRCSAYLNCITFACINILTLFR